jgi:hypothetical protein
VTWGTSIKPFYRDSLVALRRAIFIVLQYIIRKAPQFPQKPAPELKLTSNVKSKWATHIARTAPKAETNLGTILAPPRVVIVTRNGTLTDENPYRKLSKDSEARLLKAFEARGASAVICCNFKYVNTASALMSYFGHVDICIGIHGAGLSNCVFGKDGLVMLEMQVHHAYGFDSFMKIAHMAGGSYLFYDTRETPKLRAKGAGAILDQQTVEKMADLALEYYYKQHDKQSNNNGVQPFSKSRGVDVDNTIRDDGEESTELNSKKISKFSAAKPIVISKNPELWYYPVTQLDDHFVHGDYNATTTTVMPSFAKVM